MDSFSLNAHTLYFSASSNLFNFSAHIAAKFKMEYCATFTDNVLDIEIGTTLSFVQFGYDCSLQSRKDCSPEYNPDKE